MILSSSPLHTADLRELGIWLITLLVVIFGSRYVKDIIVFVLDKLYEIFIQQNPTL